MPRSRRLAAVMLGTLSLVSGNARAQQRSGQDSATAQALFDDGKKLMQAGKFGEACPKLEESQRLDPGGGTLLAIALCHEGQGRTATAWADFNSVLSDARKDKRPEREAAALEHIRALEKKMARAQIVVAKKVPGLEVKRDGSAVGEAQWSTALPIDPGEHKFEASAPGKRPWAQAVSIRDEAQTVVVNVPALEDAPVAMPTAPALRPATAPEPVSDGPRKGHGDPNEGVLDRRTLALVVGGAGVVLAGVGAGFGLSAKSKWDEAKRACPSTRCANASAVQMAATAGRNADFSTVFFILGAAGIGGATVLYLTAPPAAASNKASIQLSPIFGHREAGLSIGGTL